MANTLEAGRHCLGQNVKGAMWVWGEELHKAAAVHVVTVTIRTDRTEYGS